MHAWSLLRPGGSQARWHCALIEQDLLTSGRTSFELPTDRTLHRGDGLRPEDLVAMIPTPEETCLLVLVSRS